MGKERNDCCLDTAKGILTSKYYEALTLNPSLSVNIDCIYSLVYNSEQVEATIACGGLLLGYATNPSVGGSYFNHFNNLYGIDLSNCL